MPSSIAARSALVIPYRSEKIADRGHLLHSLLKLTLEQNRWLLDLPNAFAIRAELTNLLPLLSGRINNTMLRDPEVVEWVLQGVQEMTVWLKARRAIKIQAEPILPRVNLGPKLFLTAKAPDISFTMGNNGQLTIVEVKNGRAALKIQELKLKHYGVAMLLLQHSLGNPITCVQLRWVGVVYPGENGIPEDCQQLLRVTSQKLTLKAANRWLKKYYKLGFRQVLANMAENRR